MLRVARLVLDRAGTLPLRIGVNSGPVFAGDFGPAFRRTYSVKGDAINLAARVMSKAAPGQLLATPEVVARSQTVFRTTELAAVPGQGQGRARARGSPSAPWSVPATRSAPGAPLVGPGRGDGEPSGRR